MSTTSLTTLDQATAHMSFDTAFQCNRFPYIFGQHSTIRVWINQHSKGDRLVYSCFNVHTDTWTKPKESPSFSFVFLFHDDERNFVFDQCLDFANLTLSNVLYIAEHYYTTDLQKQRIVDYLALSSNSELMRLNALSLVWLNQEQMAENDQEFLVLPFSVPKSNIWKDDPIVSEPVGHVRVKKPVGRPSKKAQSIVIADAKPGDAIPTITSCKQEPQNVTVLSNYQAKDHGIESLVAADVALHGKEATLAKYSAYFTEQITFRKNRVIQTGGFARKALDDYNNHPETRRAVNISAPHDEHNNHVYSLDYMERDMVACNNLWSYIVETEERFKAILETLK